MRTMIDRVLGRKLSFTNLLMAIFLLLAFYPAVQGRDLAGHLLNIFFTWTLVSAIYALARERLFYRILSLVLGIPAIALLWFEQMAHNDALEVAAYISVGVFIFFATIRILIHVIGANKVTKDTLAGAACGYLMIGIVWGIVYLVIETLLPGSFDTGSVPGQDLSSKWPTFKYYSYVTLTTTGYGDIVPISPWARTFSILEAVTGVLFTAILVARLVGLYISQNFIKSGVEKGS